MSTLVKLNHENLTNALVEIKYKAKMPFSLLLGKFSTALEKDYTYTNTLPPVKTKEGVINKTHVLSVNAHFFYNDKIKIEFKENAILFSCLEDYVYWDVYESLIKDVLNKLFEVKMFEHFERVGVRYINEYIDPDMSKNMNIDLKVNIADCTISNTIFRTEFKSGDFIVVLSLSIDVPTIIYKPEKSNVVQTRIDIDVIRLHIKIDNLSELFMIINDAHTKEKDIFVSLLKTDFLKSKGAIFKD